MGPPCAVLLHELGHALAARAAGVDVVRFQLGVGELRWRRHALGAEWALARRLTGASIVVCPRRVAGWRRRRILIAVAGPLYLGRIALAKLTWPLAPELDDDAALERLLFPDEHKPVACARSRTGRRSTSSYGAST